MTAGSRPLMVGVTPLCSGVVLLCPCALCSVLIVKGLDVRTSEETVSGSCSLGLWGELALASCVWGGGRVVVLLESWF